MKNINQKNYRKPTQFKLTAFRLVLVALASAAIVLFYVVCLDISEHVYSAVTSLDVWLIIIVIALVLASGIIMLGRYRELQLIKKEEERSKKIELYDEFLKELSRTFRRDHSNSDFIDLLIEWQSTFLLWGNAETLNALGRWNKSLTFAEGKDSLIMLDDFIRALRKEIGHPDSHLEQGAFIHLMINHGAFLIEHSRQE